MDSMSQFKEGEHVGEAGSKFCGVVVRTYVEDGAHWCKVRSCKTGKVRSRVDDVLYKTARPPCPAPVPEAEKGGEST